MLTRPRWLLHLEGACIFFLSLAFYQEGHFSWWFFAALFLTPDLFMFGYVVNVKLGAAGYNLAHTLAVPIVLLLICRFYGLPAATPYALIWLAHIGFDRMLGYGLKYPTQFKDTHLQHV